MTSYPAFAKKAISFYHVFRASSSSAAAAHAKLPQLWVPLEEEGGPADVPRTEKRGIEGSGDDRQMLRLLPTAGGKPPQGERESTKRPHICSTYSTTLAP